MPGAQRGKMALEVRPVPRRLVAGLVVGATLAGLAVAWWALPPQPSGPEVRVVIDKARNRLYFYDRGRMVESYPVATGRGPELTPEGRFTVASKCTDPEGGPAAGSLYGARWIGLATPGHGDGSKYGIHGTNEPASVGTHASAGCVRMRDRDIRALYDRLQIGDVVEIRRGSLFRWYLGHWLGRTPAG